MENKIYRFFKDFRYSYLVLCYFFFSIPMLETNMCLICQNINRNDKICFKKSLLSINQSH